MSAHLADAWRSLEWLLATLASTVVLGAAEHPPERECFPRPSSCGYPDATNTGVPAGTKLTRSGSLRIDEDGQTLDRLRIAGAVTIEANDVTIQNSRIVRRSGGSGSYGVLLARGADGFTIRDSEIVGPRSNSNGLESAVWNHYNNPGATAVRSHFHRCAVCWEGAGTFRDAYMVVDAAYSGSHDENIYVCGGRVKVVHSTLVNRHGQTATVFGDTAGCGGNRFTVTGSLLAGGGYVLYPQANSSTRTGSMTVTGNRFARCATKPIYDPSGGGMVCRGGPDANGLFPNGGYYGVAAYYHLGQGNAWRRNFWDDNLRPVCPSGSCRGGR